MYTSESELFTPVQAIQFIGRNPNATCSIIFYTVDMFLHLRHPSIKVRDFHCFVSKLNIGSQRVLYGLLNNGYLSANCLL